MKSFKVISTALAPIIAILAGVPTLEAQGHGRGRPPAAPGGAMQSPSGQPPAAGRGAQQRMEQSPSATRLETRVSHDLSRNEQLKTRLQPLFPAGTDLSAASQGFKNTGQFVAAAHVSKNLDIPFTDLKARMMNGDSLGDAVRALKPDMEPAEVKKQVKSAERRAKQDVQSAPAPPAS
ncbi:MAG: hypothetical protein HYX27_09210 [Acidobacteria bacterium]|nr:hypothetical protein [Acidobacteriota bacterium]